MEFLTAVKVDEVGFEWFHVYEEGCKEK